MRTLSPVGFAILTKRNSIADSSVATPTSTSERVASIGRICEIHWLGLLLWKQRVVGARANSPSQFVLKR